MRAAIYCRVSTSEQEEKSSLRTQQQHARAHAKERGYEVSESHVYSETYTGIELWDRPKLQELRSAVRQHEIDVVIAYAIDRLSRDPVHLGVILSEADHAGVEVEFVTEPLDNSPEGQLIRFVRGYAAKVEHEKIRERTMRGTRARVASGKPLATYKALYGYKWNTDKSAYIEDPATSWVVKRIFEESASGKGLLSIRRGLVEDRIPSPSGGNWTGGYIGKMLHHRGYIGEQTAFRSQFVTVRGSKKQISRPQSEHVLLPPEACPPIISHELFYAVQNRLPLNKKLATRNNRNPEASLLRGGYARCGYCGASMIVRPVKNARYYSCHRARVDGCTFHGIATHILDPLVWAKVEAVLTDPEIVAREIERQSETLSEEIDLTQINRSIAELKRKQSRERELVRQMYDPSDPEATAPFTVMLRSLRAQELQLLEERKHLEQQAESARQARAQLQDLQDNIELVAANLSDFSYENQRLALEALGVGVKVWGRKHTPRYEITMSIVSHSSCARS